MKSVRLMTSNIWGDYFGNPVEPRGIQLKRVFARYAPDILGFQEVTKNWWKSELLRTMAPAYAMVDVNTGGRNNYTPLFYRQERFELLDKSYYLYHESLDASKGYTCGVFRDKADGTKLAVFCTHFWWKLKEEDHVIRYYNAKDLLTEMKRVTALYGCPSFFMGDVNCGIPSLAWEYVNREKWYSAYQRTADFSNFSTNHHDPVKDENGVYHGKVTDEPVSESLDHVGVPENVRVLKHLAVTDQDALDATDHCPVVVDVEW